MAKPDTHRWKEVRRSEFTWERDALDFIKEGLPDTDPYWAWSNFEFVTQDGAVYEVDLLVLTPRGLVLVEIKSRPGKVTGEAGTWTWRDGPRTFADDNPLLLANRKAKKLGSLLRSTNAFGSLPVPSIEPWIFLSDPNQDCRLEGAARSGVHLRDGKDRRGIRAALTEAQNPGRSPIDRRTSKALELAMDRAGVRPSRRATRIGDYDPKELLFEGKGYQDYSAVHPSLPNLQRRLRVYSVARDAPSELRATVARAARREFQILHGLEHPGILKAIDYREDPRGIVLIFDHDPAALRLDHFLATYGESLGLDQRLELLRKIAEALRYAHGRRLFHRALSPASILVRKPKSGAIDVKIFNWQTAAREIGITTGGGKDITATQHLEHLIDDAATVYLAPETFTAGVREDATPQDVFSLGAVTYHLFAGSPPAATFEELQTRLREGGGLQITGALEGAPEVLREMVQFATNPDVAHRTESVQEFLGYLDDLEDKLTTPEPAPLTDPTQAKAGDLLPGGFEVVRALGRGSSAVVYLVRHEGLERVLKLALHPDLNSRLAAEAATLKLLRHHHIVALHGEAQIGAHLGLLLERAGETTLGERLRSEGRLALDLLQRFGDDLLQVVQHLEEQAVSHRDLKPDNIGIAQRGKKDTLRLVLFDFSLAATSAEVLTAGTRPYVDPFFACTKPPRRCFDSAAERWSATLTLHEMATGTLPRFGDGQSDPAAISDEATIDAELFDPAVRESLLAFFAKALRRDARERFDNAEEMLLAWRQAFADVDQPAIPTEKDDDPARPLLLEGATVDSALAALGLSTRALNALERVQALVVKDLLALPESRLHVLRGVGNKTRRELLLAQQALAARFKTSHLLPIPPDDSDQPSLDRVVAVVQSTAAWLLPAAGSNVWPTIPELSEREGLPTDRLLRQLGDARKLWASDPKIALVRTQIDEILERHAGIATAPEVAAALLLLRGSVAAEPERSLHALVVVRAAAEAERLESAPRFDFRRTERTVLLFRAESGGGALLSIVLRLGVEADRLAGTDPLPSPARVQEVFAVLSKDAELLPLSRQLRLAAAGSKFAALSPRLEIYPAGLPAERALKLAHGALLGSDQLTPKAIRERVLGRFPESEPLPDRPELDRLLSAAGWPIEWNPAADRGNGAYLLRPAVGPVFTSGSTGILRRTTDLGAPPRDSPEIADARLFEERLRRSASDGAFLVLSVDPAHQEAALTELQRRLCDALAPVDLEARLLAGLRREAEKARVAWDVVLQADAAEPTERNFQNLLRLVQRAIPELEAELQSSTRTLLLVRSGLLARYDQLGLLVRLRERVGMRQGDETPALHGVWVLIPADDQQELPVLDGRPIPVLARSQHARIPRAWIENLHRTPAPTEAAP